MWADNLYRQTIIRHIIRAGIITFLFIKTLDLFYLRFFAHAKK